MACLNQWDQQSHRLFSTDGVMQTLYSGENAGGNTVAVLIRKKNKNMVCTREFALEEVEKHITNAIHWSIKASMDEHFISDLKHLYSVANANRICADKKSATENAMQAETISLNKV